MTFGFALTDMEHDNFNSHARVGRDKTITYVASMFSNFNSHARVGRDMAVTNIIREENISTHTPV